MRPARTIPEPLGARIVDSAPLWCVRSRRRSLLAFRTPLAIREYTAGCPRYVLMHNDVGASKPAYYGHRSLRVLEEHAREILAEALRALEGEA